MREHHFKDHLGEITARIKAILIDIGIKINKASIKPTHGKI
jgi:hypothetical protein